MSDTSNMQMELSFDGRTYKMAVGDFTGADDLAIYQKVGKTIAEIYQGDITLFTVAALLWRWRVNHGEPQITFEQINAKLTFTDLMVDSSGEGEESPSNPEA